MKSPLTEAVADVSAPFFQNSSKRTLLFSLFASTPMVLESFANLRQYFYITSVQMIDIRYEILRTRCWIIKEIRFVMRIIC